MRPVDFFIVGQPKSGTTALASFLDQHPEICFARPKEPGFMATDLARESIAFHGDDRLVSIRSESAYEACFAHGVEGQRRGEGTTLYLHSQEAAQTIARHNPDARIVVMLRDPVDMVHALHMEHVNLTHEPLTRLQDALDAEEARSRGENLPRRVPVPSALLYRRRAHSAPQVRRFVEVFGRQAVGVWTMSDLRDSPEDTYAQVLRHIGVDDSHRPEFSEVHGAKRPRSQTLNSAVRATWVRAGARRVLGPQGFKWVQQRVVEPLVLTRGRREPMPEPLRHDLREEFAADVAELSELIGRDLVKEWGY